MEAAPRVARHTAMRDRSRWPAPGRNWGQVQVKVSLNNRSFAIAAVALVLLLPPFSFAQGQRGRGARGDQPAGGGQAPARGGRGGRGGQPAPPSAPTPYWPDGRVNLDAAPGQKGFWNVGTGAVVGRNGSALQTN